MEFGIITSILILIALAVLVSAVFHRLRLPSILGYIIIGVLLGPNMLNIVTNTAITHTLAELGIVFLLFTIGLGFSVTKFKSLQKIVFGFGLLQVLLSIMVTALISQLFDMTLAQGIIVGCIVAMSSTALVLKQLTDQLELNTSHGANALGILLLQDLAVIPVLILIPSFTANTHHLLLVDSMYAFARGFVAILIILGIGRWILKPLFYRIAATRSIELFSLTALFTALGAAWLTNLFGLSLILGAFIAGLVLSETEFRHQIEVDIRPFRDILLAIFFISIGSQLNLSLIKDAWVWVSLLVAALIVFKIILISLLGIFFKNSALTSLRTGLVLAQGGEFGFAVLILTNRYNILPQDYGQVVLGALLISLIIAPVIIRFNKLIAYTVLPKHWQKPPSVIDQTITQVASELSHHVIICGYGRVGQTIAKFLSKVDVPYVALDLDPARIQTAVLAGEPVCYGDASHYHVLEAVGVERAKAVIISFYHANSAAKILQQTRLHNKRIPIIVRSHYDSETEQFYQLGASEVIPETFEASIMLASHLLMLLKIPLQMVDRLIEESRHNRYDLLKRVFPGEQTYSPDEDATIKVALHAVYLPETAACINKQVSDIDFDAMEVSIQYIRKKDNHHALPHPETRFAKDDVVILYGELPKLEAAERLLLEGK